MSSFSLGLSQAGEVFWGLLDPWVFMAHAAAWLPGTVVRLVRARRFDVLLSPARLRDAWFGAFWQWAGPNIKLNAEKRVLPLLAGRTTGGRIIAADADAAPGPGLEGVVMELGAGSGFWVDVFAEPGREETDDHDDEKENEGSGRGVRKGITRVLGVEPNAAQHASLRRRVRAAGLEGVYDIVPVGVEDLGDASKWEGRVEPGSVDCIVSVLCLCSIPDPPRQFRALYAYLKPGGRWYVYEHVRTEAGWAMRTYQGELLESLLLLFFALFSPSLLPTPSKTSKDPTVERWID